MRFLGHLGIEAREKACPLLVPLVEEGWLEHPVTEQVARIYLDEAFANGVPSADVLVLGCTHYPLLKPLLRRVVPPRATIVDSAESTAHVVAEQAVQDLVAVDALVEDAERLLRGDGLFTDIYRKRCSADLEGSGRPRLLH